MMAINYIEKGVGLHDAITESGHSLARVDGVWVASDEAAVQAIIDAYDPAATARAGMVLTDIQFAQVCVVAGILTPVEAEGWVASGQIPAIALAAIETLPAEQRPFARIRFAGARTIERLNPFMSLLQATLAAAGSPITDEHLDAMFIQGAAL
jgi:hypothetical protein